VEERHYLSIRLFRVMKSDGATKLGYSSLGRISPSVGGTVRSYIAIGIAALKRKRGATMVRVETTTLDVEVGDRIVDFLKVDVQGAERQVLEGAISILQSHQIRLMYLEWSGDREVERLLNDSGYSVFDSVYVGSGSSAARIAFEGRGFEVIGSLPLSTGEKAPEMAYRGANSDIGSVLRELNQRGHWIQTDLVALPAVDAAEYVEFLRTG